MSHLNAIHPDIRGHAADLIGAGYVVYAEKKPRLSRAGLPVPLRFFHYSREVGGRVCYGTVSMSYFGEELVTMPVQPSRENGSGVMVAERRKVTLDDMKKAASPRNQQPWKGGPVLANAKPWGVPDVYEPVE